LASWMSALSSRMLFDRSSACFWSLATSNVATHLISRTP
jgi:hypothetical protein